MTNKYEQYVKAIQEVALDPQTDNCVPVELAYQQALSIHLRSRQLVQEGITHPNTLTPAAKKRQIDRCYDQRGRL